jgi:hypothetical protein
MLVWIFPPPHTPLPPPRSPHSYNGGTTLMTSSNTNYLPRPYLPLNTTNIQIWGLIFQHMNSCGTPLNQATYNTKGNSIHFKTKENTNLGEISESYENSI